MIWRSIKSGLSYELLDSGLIRVIDTRRDREGLFNPDGTRHSGDIPHCDTDSYHMIEWVMGFEKAKSGLAISAENRFLRL